MPSETDLGWAAGFLEGEGSFGFNGKRGGSGTPSIQAAQVQEWPLLRLKELFGGTVSCYPPRKPQHSPYHQWSRCGGAAMAIMQRLLPLMSPKRQEQILVALDKANARRGRLWALGQRKPLCLRGHQRTPDNLTPRLGCRTCERGRHRLARANRKAA